MTVDQLLLLNTIIMAANVALVVVNITLAVKIHRGLSKQKAMRIVLDNEIALLESINEEIQKSNSLRESKTRGEAGRSRD